MTTTLIALLAVTAGYAVVVTVLLVIAQYGNSDLAEEVRAERKRVGSMKRREVMLLDDLDFACAEAVSLRERVDQLEAEALPKAPNWGNPPAMRVAEYVPERTFYSIDGAS